MSDYSQLLFEENDGVAKITLNRPNAANALGVELARDLMKAAIQCDESKTIRVVILTGAGKLFCAGGDIQAFGGDTANVGALVKEITAYLHAAIARFARMNPPLIIAVNGAAAGAGFSLALAGDIVFAAESAKFTSAYTALGASPDGSASYFLPRIVGLRRAQELFLTNRTLSGSEAAEWGLATYCVADGELMAEAEKMAQKLARGPRESHGMVKKLLISSFDQPLETQMEFEARGIAASLGNADGQEGIVAFLEKRKPQFSL